MNQKPSVARKLERPPRLTVPSPKTTEVVGSHTYYFVDGTWTRDDYEDGTDAPTIEVGSDEFLELITEDPSLADAAALGERVVTEGPQGWITITWPDLGG